MTPAALLARLHREGFAFDAADGKLWVRPPAGRALTPEEHEAMRQHKAAMIDLLAWPPECWEAEALYHRPPVLVAPHARLFPLLGRRVLTPRGPGRLLQVFASLAAVALDSEPDWVTIFEPAELRPERGCIPDDGRPPAAHRLLRRPARGGSLPGTAPR